MASSRRGKKKDVQEDEPLLTWLIWETFQYTHRSLDNVLRSHGVTSTQLGILNRVAARPGLSGAELSRLMLTTTQAANLALIALERKRLVERNRDNGVGHVLRTVLTDEGRNVMRSCRSEVVVVERQLMAALSLEERKMLKDLLHNYLAPWALATDPPRPARPRAEPSSSPPPRAGRERPGVENGREAAGRR